MVYYLMATGVLAWLLGGLCFYVLLSFCVGAWGDGWTVARCLLIGAPALPCVLALLVSLGICAYHDEYRRRQAGEVMVRAGYNVADAQGCRHVEGDIPASRLEDPFSAN